MSGLCEICIVPWSSLRIVVVSCLSVIVRQYCFCWLLVVVVCSVVCARCDLMFVNFVVHGSVMLFVWLVLMILLAVGGCWLFVARSLLVVVC